MEITNEIITQLRANYLGQPFVMLINDGTFKTEKLTVGMLTLFNDEDKIILKPLSEISDDDLIELCKITGFSHLQPVSNRIDFMKEIIFKHKDTTGSVILWLRIYQFLQSKGYDLPQYLLDNKTLKEAGLAIYESDIK